MASINEILNRDHRTTSNHKFTVDYQLQRFEEDEIENFDKCDKCQNESHSDKKSNHFAKSYTKLLRKRLFSCYLVITLSVCIMYSNQAEASPIPATIDSSHDEVDKINFLNLQCDVSASDDLPRVPLSDSALRERLKAVLVSCNSALHTTKHLTEDYIKRLWGHEMSVNSHHKTWEHKNIPWLWPDNKPLEKHFRSDIHPAHLDHLRSTEWTREKVFEYLGKIYQRFQRIGVGVQIVNKWNELASMEGTSLLNTDQVNVSTRLFKNATDGIHEVLCQIQGIFLDMAIDPRTDLDITPFIMDKFIKLNHWLVYREYENLMDYSHKLLTIITDDKKHAGK